MTIFFNSTTNEIISDWYFTEFKNLCVTLKILFHQAQISFHIRVSSENGKTVTLQVLK